MFAPKGDWCCGRAIDADVCVFQGKLHLYFATRDHEMRIQKVGGAWAPLTSGFGRNTWTMLAEQSLLTPELRWEGECIEAPAVMEQGGIFFQRIFQNPFLPCGAPDAWNSSESGHPYIFRMKTDVFI